MLWVKIIGALALLAGLVLGVHTYNESLRDEGYQKAVSEYSAKLIAAQASARKIEDTWRKQQEESNAKATKRQQVLVANLATADLANRSLLDDLANLRGSLPGDSPAALVARATTLSTLLGDCSQNYRRMGESADRHVNDLQRYIEQWPKVVESK